MAALKVKLTGAQAGFVANELLAGGMVASATQQQDFSYVLDLGDVADNDEAKAWADGLVANLRTLAQEKGVTVEVV